MALGRLRALDIEEERALAGRLACLLYLTGAVTAVILLFLPGVETRHWPVVLAVAAAGALWSVACFALVPWERASPVVSHLSSLGGFPCVAVSMAATGGAASPARFFLFFIVFYCSYFYPPREAIPYLAGCVVVDALPLVYDRQAVAQGHLGELLIVGPTYAVLGGLIMSGKRLLLELREREHELSLRDPLTDLANRRAMLEWMDRHVTRRAGTTGLLLVDLDGFKNVNTVHGYHEGDRVLCGAARALSTCVRDQDLVARLGGDEFAIVVPGASAVVMRRLSDRALEAVREMSAAFELDDVRLTASVGWALYPDDAGDWQDLVAAADFCMRAAKQSGKDKALSALDWLPETAVG